jgi:hypothetical protein
MDSHYAKLFRVLDGYARKHHECFLTELFLNAEGDEYFLCFRPLEPQKALLTPTGCCYVTIGIGEAVELIRAGLLTISIANILDEKLPRLTHAQGD